MDTKDNVHGVMLGYRLSEDDFIDRSEKLLTELCKEILNYGQLGLTESQFKIFRKKIFDLIDGDGVKKRIEELVRN